MSNNVIIYATQDARHVNLAPALDHGDSIVAMTPAGDANFSLDETRARIYECMGRFNPDVDKILVVGDPITMVMVGAAFKDKFPHYLMTVLKWDRMSGRYIELTVDP